MAKVVRFHQLGGAEVLKLEEVPVREPGKGEIRLKVDAIGLNRAEVYFREGNYVEQPEFPSSIGYEASGVVEAVGEGMTELKVGAGRLKPVIDRTFKLNDIVEAHRYMESGQQNGKIVVTV